MYLLWRSPGDAVIKNLPASAGNARHLVSIPVLGRCPGEGNGNPLWYSCLENFMNRRAWWLGVTRSQTTELLHTHAYPLRRNVYSSPLPFFWLRPKAWRILFPWPEVELGPRPLAAKVWSSDHGTAREFPPVFIFSEAVCPSVVEFCCCWEYVLAIKSLSSYIICKHFLSLCRLSLHLLIMSFMYTGFNADEFSLLFPLFLLVLLVLPLSFRWQARLSAIALCFLQEFYGFSCDIQVVTICNHSCTWCEVGAQVHSCSCGNAVIQVPFVEKTALSQLIGFGILVKNQWAVDIWIYF